MNMNSFPSKMISYSKSLKEKKNPSQDCVSRIIFCVYSSCSIQSSKIKEDSIHIENKVITITAYLYNQRLWNSILLQFKINWNMI